ncbi:hypothetical protein IQ235_13355 [Oscillatoriales cyanobacterium LEGE 11467]|uniref:Uncharacterized protein n=1 Tax=Zarconia navalis LEGE 11467 TaxID=1828826 RepID=A0A928Z7T7_9CYAN|nr:hypothetical protein [Zarconia navalis LEGE 11467]
MFELICVQYVYSISCTLSTRSRCWQLSILWRGRVKLSDRDGFAVVPLGSSTALRAWVGFRSKTKVRAT